jgi:hypothetical protein
MHGETKVHGNDSSCPIPAGISDTFLSIGSTPIEMVHPEESRLGKFEQRDAGVTEERLSTL